MNEKRSSLDNFKMYAGILSQLCLHAKVRGDKTALRVLGGKEKVVNEVTYSELWRMIMQFSNYLEHVCGLKQGERFCVCLDNSVELICMYAASLATKTVCIPIDYLAPLGAVLDILQQVRPRWILLADVSLQKCVSEKFSNAVMLDLNEMQSCCNGAEIVHELCCTVEPWVVLFTSGTTTGVKKGVVRTELGSVAGFFSHCPDMHFCSEDIFLAIYPLHAISSFFFVFMHLYFGASCCMLSRVDSHVPEILMHVLHSQKITFTTAGPMQVSCMIKTGIQCPASLSRILVSGAVTKEVVQNRIRLFFATAKVFEIYGSTEAGLITLLSPEQQLLHPGSVGIEPAGNLEVQFVHPVDEKLMAITSKDQPGEILVYTPMLFLEFFERSDLNNRCRTGQGYFKTGDLGYKGNDGFLYLSGRIDDRIGEFILCTQHF